MVNYDICPRCHEYVQGSVTPETWQCPRCGASRILAVYQRDFPATSSSRKKDPPKNVQGIEPLQRDDAPDRPALMINYRNVDETSRPEPWRGIVRLVVAGILGILLWQMLTNPNLAQNTPAANTPENLFFSLGMSFLLAILFTLVQVSYWKPSKHEGREKPDKATA